MSWPSPRNKHDAEIVNTISLVNWEDMQCSQSIGIGIILMVTLSGLRADVAPDPEPRIQSACAEPGDWAAPL